MSNKTGTQEKLWNRNYIMVLLVCTLSAFSFYTNQTILSKHLTGNIGVSMTLAGTIVGLFSLTSLFCRPFCGVMADRMNKVLLMMLSNILMKIDYVIKTIWCVFRLAHKKWIRMIAQDVVKKPAPQTAACDRTGRVS